MKNEEETLNGDGKIYFNSGSFRTTVEMSLNADQFSDFIGYLTRHNIKHKTLKSRWVPDGTPDEEGYMKVEDK